MAGKQKTSAAGFESEAQQKRPSLLSEFYDLAAHNKKWWLLPILVFLLLTGLLILFTTTGAGMAIYTLF